MEHMNMITNMITVSDAAAQGRGRWGSGSPVQVAASEVPQVVS